MSINKIELYEDLSRKEMAKCKIMLDEVKSAYYDMCSPMLKSNRKFNHPPFRIVYMLTYCACLTGVVEHFFRKAIANCLKVKQLMENLMDTSGITLCSIGGGPGADLVGFLSALNTFCKERVLRSVVILDQRNIWRATFNMLVYWLVRNFVRFIPINILHQDISFEVFELKFMQAFKRSFKRKIKSANVILMIECSSMYPEDTIKFAMQSIVEAIDVGTLVIFLDSSIGFANAFKTRWCVYGEILYGPVTVQYNLPQTKARKENAFREIVPQVSCDCVGMVLRKICPPAFVPLIDTTQVPIKNESLDISKLVSELTETIVMESVNVNFDILKHQ